MTAFWAMVFVVHLLVNAFANVYIAWLAKRLPKARALVWQYVFAALFTSLVAVASGAYNFSWPVFGVGIFAAVGSYCQWQAYACAGGLSKTSLFVPLISVWAALLAALFLPDEKLLYQKSWLTAGIVLLHVAPFLLARRTVRADTKTQRTFDFVWLGYTAAMIGIQGGLLFFIKFLSLAQPITVFFSSWYAGGALGACLLVSLLEKHQRRLAVQEVWQIIPAGASVCLAMSLLYWVLSAVSGGLIFPLKSFCSAILPILSAWFILNERRGFDVYQWLGFGLGFLGVVFVAWSQTGLTP